MSFPRYPAEENSVQRGLYYSENETRIPLFFGGGKVDSGWFKRDTTVNLLESSIHVGPPRGRTT